MTMMDQGPTSGIVERVKGILLKPGAEWEKIDGEPATIKGLYTGYVGPLAAIPPIASAIGMSLVGVGVLGVSIKTPLAASLVNAVVQWVLTLVGVFVLALIIEALAPSFGGVKDRIQAFKVAAYSWTASWVAGILLLLPALLPLATLLSLYSLFLLYKGLPKLMKAPEEKALPYTAVTVVAAVVLFLVIGAVTAAVGGALRMGSPFGAGPDVMAGSVKIGGTEVDLGKLEADAKRLEAQAKQLQAQAEGKAVDGAAPAIPVDTLKGLLPGSVAGLPRTEVNTGSGGLGGIQASSAGATYGSGEARITLSINDTTVMGGMMGMAGALNVNSSSETATSYEKMGVVGGRMTQERYDRSSRSGEYGVLIGSRFMVHAEGSSVSMDQLKAAVGAVDAKRLERLAAG